MLTGASFRYTLCGQMSGHNVTVLYRQINCNGLGSLFGPYSVFRIIMAHPKLPTGGCNPNTLLRPNTESSENGCSQTRSRRRANWSGATLEPGSSCLRKIYGW